MSRSVSIAAHDAAAAIVALINSSPRSPRIEEVAAIIARAVSSQAFADDHHARIAKVKEFIKKCEAADAKMRETNADADDDDADRLTGEFGRYCDTIYSVPSQTLTGLQERAEIARYWHQIVGEEWDEPDDCDDWGNRTIAELIKAVLEFGPPPPTKRMMSASEIDFKPILGSDGKPISFDFTNAEFADRYCPWIRLAFVLLSKDREGLIDGIKEFANDGEASSLVDGLVMWEEIENKFEALSAFASAIWARITTAMEVLEEQDPSMARKLEPIVDGYIAARREAEAAA